MPADGDRSILMDPAVSYFSTLLRKKLSSNLKEVMLFGSRAREDHHEGSDYDFLIILDRKNKDIIKLIREIEIDFLNKYDTVSASIIYDESEWEKRKTFPIGINILREGKKI